MKNKKIYQHYKASAKQSNILAEALFYLSKQHSAIFLFFVISFLLPHYSTAQFVYENRVYSPVIKTVQLYQLGNNQSEPVIYLNKDKKLMLEFDELSEQTHRYEYSLTLCNADWTENSMDRNNYLEGFDVQSIEHYENSFNTIQRYVHYSQTILSNGMRLTKSGNYILKVFREDNPENVIFTRRLYLVDDRAEVQVEVKQPMNSAYMRTHQEVDVKVVGKNGEFFSNPEQNMIVLVRQNFREDTERQLKMRSMIGNKIDYSFDVSNLFEAGNEYRFFDFTSMRLKTQYIASFDYVNNENQVYLRQEKIHSTLPHTSDKDLNGAYYIRNEYGDYSIQSDYAWVHFFLPISLNLEGEYYVVGQVTDGRMSSINKMKFENGMYHLAMYLKQGYYNYHIIFKRPSEMIGSTSQVEGNYWETNNRYKVFVYYKNFADDYDEIVGFVDIEYGR